MGARRFEIFHLGLAANVLSRYGQHAAAKVAITAAFEALASNRDMPFVPDLHRLRAAAVLRASADTVDEAVADLHQALKIARDQGARLLELRAARDLARVLGDNNERQRALDLLAPVYGWFTEGFDTPDMSEAKQLLSELGWTSCPTLLTFRRSVVDAVDGSPRRGQL